MTTDMEALKNTINSTLRSQKYKSNSPKNINQIDVQNSDSNNNMNEPDLASNVKGIHLYFSPLIFIQVN